MKGWGVRTLVVLVLLISSCVATVNVANAATAEIVTEVAGLRDYVPGDDSFTHGNTLRVYTEMSDVNYEGFVFVEFVFIIKDPKGNVVSMDRMSFERRDYTDHAYVVYSKAIPYWWRYGKYKIEIYAYDRINKAKIRELERRVDETDDIEALLGNEDAFEDLEEFFESGSGADDLGVLRSFPDSEREKKRIYFYVRRAEDITPMASEEAERIEASGFTITDVKIDKFKVKPDEPITVSVTVENRGAQGTKKISLVINGEVVAEESVTLNRLASKTIHFTSDKNLPGTYKVSILGTDIVKVFFVEEPSEVEEGGDDGGNSTASVAPVGPQPDNGEEDSNPVFALAIAALVAIFALVIILRHVNSKQQLGLGRFSRR